MWLSVKLDVSCHTFPAGVRNAILFVFNNFPCMCLSRACLGKSSYFNKKTAQQKGVYPAPIMSLTLKTLEQFPVLA